VTRRIRKHVLIDPELLAELESHLTNNPESSLSNQVNAALREYLSRRKAGQEDLLLAPVFERLLKERVEQMENWLRSGVWAGATYSATATLLLLEILCGQTVDPKDAREHLNLIRGRAWKMVRKTSDAEGGV
jgi:hypothetical protein